MNQPVQHIPPPPPQATASRAGPILILVGGATMVVAPFLPWATVTTVFVSASVNGIEGDGTITLVLGIVVAIMGILELTNDSNTRVWATICGAGALAIGVYDFTRASEILAGASSDFVRAAVGVGLYAVIAGAALAFVGGLISRR